jgi:hypothetical protein
MAAGSDGSLYVLGNDGTPGGDRLFRLEGSTLVPVATTGKSGTWLAADRPAVFLVAASGAFTGLYNHGNLWLLDPHRVHRLSSRGQAPAFTSRCRILWCAYDASRQLIYALESNGRLSAIALNPSVPTTPETWGSVKARYRR